MPENYDYDNLLAEQNKAKSDLDDAVTPRNNIQDIGKGPNKLSESMRRQMGTERYLKTFGGK